MDAATETEEASNASIQWEETPKEPEEEADAAMAVKELADVVIELGEGASVDTETEEANDPGTKTKVDAATPDVESVPKAPEEEKVPSETPDEELEVVETIAQVSILRM